MTDTDRRPSPVDRPVADSELVLRVLWTGLDKDSPEWRALAEALVEYAYVVLVAWAVTGELGHKVARHAGAGRGRVPRTLRLEPDDAHALAVDVLIESIEQFRTKSLRCWTPVGGASLRTFFVGRCLLDLPDVYCRWRQGQAPQPELVDDGCPCASPEDDVVNRMLVDELLDDDPELRAVLELQGQGYQWDEIAGMLGATTPAIKSRTWRGVQRLRKEGL